MNSWLLFAQYSSPHVSARDLIFNGNTTYTSHFDHALTIISFLAEDFSILGFIANNELPLWIKFPCIVLWYNKVVEKKILLKRTKGEIVSIEN